MCSKPAAGLRPAGSYPEREAAAEFVKLHPQLAGRTEAQAASGYISDYQRIRTKMNKEVVKHQNFYYFPKLFNPYLFPQTVISKAAKKMGSLSFFSSRQVRSKGTGRSDIG